MSVCACVCTTGLLSCLNYHKGYLGRESVRAIESKRARESKKSTEKAEHPLKKKQQNYTVVLNHRIFKLGNIDRAEGCKTQTSPLKHRMGFLSYAGSILTHRDFKPVSRVWLNRGIHIIQTNIPQQTNNNNSKHKQ